MNRLLAALVISLAWQRLDRSPLQPYDVRSASGEWTLEVRPSKPSGAGEMQVRIVRGEEPSWAGEFPWTFEKAGVSDDGTCVGYANDAELRIAVLDAKGGLRKQHDFERGPGTMHGPRLPFASGPVLVHPTADVALIHTQTDKELRPAPWRAFRLSTGEEVAQVVPALPLEIGRREGLYAGDAQAIGSTGLTLVHWRYADFEAAGVDWPQEGAVFALHDVAGAVVWRLALLDDYTDRTSEKADDELEREVRRTGAIVSAGPGDRFALRHVREAARVDYAVEKDAGDAWRVVEVAREPWSEPRSGDTSPEPIELVKTGSIVLAAAPTSPQHPIHGVGALGFTETGELEILRNEHGRRLSYARLRTDGEVLLERDLTAALPSLDGTRQYHELAGDRWLVQRLEGDPPWLSIDVRTGESRAEPLPDGMLGCHVAPLANGDYLALVKQIVRSTAVTELYFVTAEGTVGWRRTVAGIGPDETELDRAIAFGNGIARTGKRTFAILGSGELTRIDLDGNVLAAWKLEEVLGQRVFYVNGVLSDAAGGVLFEVNDAFQRVDAYGTHTGSVVLRRADGSRDGVMDHLLAVAPDGRLWTSDRRRLYRLDEAGVADVALGPEPRDDVLGEVYRVAIDGLGRALVQDGATRSVFVFEAGGARVGICRLAPTERPDYVDVPFGGELDGSVWVATTKGKVHFDPAGTRLEGKRDDERDAAVRRKALEAVKVRPDGTWLAKVAQRALLPDGGGVILEARPGEGESAALHFYDGAGAPLHSVAIPLGECLRDLAVGPRWLVVGCQGPVWTLVRLADRHVFRFDPGLPEDGSWTPGQTPDGATLLLLDARTTELVQFALP